MGLLINAALTVLPLIFPQIKFLIPFIKIAIDVIKQLPLHKRTDALKDLHAAVQVAKKTKSTAPVEELTARMKQELHG